MTIMLDKIIDDHLDQLKEILSPEDIVIDGGNTYYKDDIRRAKLLKEKSIRFMDVGVSGGIWGLEKGYCLMVGGRKESFEYLKPIFQTLAPKDGYLYCRDSKRPLIMNPVNVHADQGPYLL